MTTAEAQEFPAEQYYPSIAAFESAEIDETRFNHHSHVYVGWCYLQDHPLHEAVARFAQALRRLTAKLGAEKKYNETITWFFMVVIAERLQEQPGLTWPEFSRLHKDLCYDAGGLLRRYYSGLRLQSDVARRVFLLPDRLLP